MLIVINIVLNSLLSPINAPSGIYPVAYKQNSHLKSAKPNRASHIAF